MMTRQEVLYELDKVLEKPRGTLTGSERLDDLPEWDSLAILAYIAMVEKKTSVVLDSLLLSRARTVNDLVLLVVPDTVAPAAHE
ncbi:MAG TPA: acyl carrier protein [Spirochaetia bacterium]|nr:acyl carrier protein [Spirochaetia bacterium]